MNNKKKEITPKNDTAYDIKTALKEFEELKNIALNCLDKNGNPNISAAIRALENKAKIAGLYNTKHNAQTIVPVSMNEITIDDIQLKLNIGEDCIDT